MQSALFFQHMYMQLQLCGCASDPEKIGIRLYGFLFNSLCVPLIAPANRAGAGTACAGRRDPAAGVLLWAGASFPRS